MIHNEQPLFLILYFALNNFLFQSNKYFKEIKKTYKKKPKETKVLVY